MQPQPAEAALIARFPVGCAAHSRGPSIRVAAATLRPFPMPLEPRPPQIAADGIASTGVEPGIGDELQQIGISREQNLVATLKEMAELNTEAQECVVCGQRLFLTAMHASRVCPSPVCQLHYRIHLERGLPCCCVCGRPVNQVAGHSAALPTCSRQTCQMRVSLLNSLRARRCKICGKHYLYAAPTEELCGDSICRQVQQERDAATHAKERARKREERRCTLRAQAAATLPDLTLPIVVLPRFQETLAGNADRRDAFRKVIASKAREAFATVAGVDPQATQLDEQAPGDPWSTLALAQACGECRGWCCRNGGNYAYLKESDLRRVAAEQGIKTWAEMVERYLSFIPEATYQESCIFHGREGCGLPRALRAETCTSFFCEAAGHLCETIRQGATTLILVSTSINEESENEPVIYSMAIVSLETGAVPASSRNHPDALPTG